MIFKILIGYIKGYLNIDVQGYYIQRFMNSCISKGIFLWNLRPQKSTYVTVNVEIADFKRLRQVAKQTKCKIKINERKGLPFILEKYKKRKIFLIFLALITIFLYTESKFIWNIQIEGTERIPDGDILTALHDNGLNIGTLKSKLDISSIINNIRLTNDDIAWMNIKLTGTNAIIQIAETTEKPDIIPFDEYCNIIATKEAEIMKVTANTGTIVAKPGDTVKERQHTDTEDGWNGTYTGIRYVHATRRSDCKSEIL